MRLRQTELAKTAGRCSDLINQAVPGVGFFELPYRHVVIDNFLDFPMARMCLTSFPPLDSGCWESANDADIEIKMRTTWKSEFDIPDGIVDAVRIMNCAPVLQAMGERLGIPKLVADPYFSGGGLNITRSGGLLDVHVDGNYHDATGLNRRANAILYLNEQWQPEWGGEFGVYDTTGRHCIKRIAPVFNRLVIFDSHDFSFHGLPEPLNFPKDQQRKSIILYYYTHAARPAHHTAVAAPHSALWVKRDGKDKRGNTTRAFN